MLEENALNIYLDGSSFSKPRRGGIGIRFIHVDRNGNEKIEDIPKYYSYKGATNNQMELQACITALEEAYKPQYLDKAPKIIIFTDSCYVAKNYLNAIFYWPKTHWLTKDGNPVLNVELWKNLVKRVKKINKRVEIKWVKGHSKNEHNEAVNKLAKQSARSPLKRAPLNIVRVRRKKTTKMVNPKSVEMKGQKISIRIITDEYLATQKINKYKYEVTSKRSRYYGNVDIIYSNINLKAGHEYSVIFNKESKTPRILKLIKEIEIK